MKLPQIGPTQGVQSLGRYDINAPVRKAEREGFVNVRRARRDQYALNVASENIKNAYESHIELRVQETDLEVQRQMSSWEAENAGKENYTAEELSNRGIEFEATEKVVDENGQVQEVNRTEIPAYEVYPQLFKQQAEAVINSQSSRIPNDLVRRRWLTGKQNVLNTKYARALEASAKAVRAHQQKRAIESVDQSLEARQYELAKEMAKSIKDPLVAQAARDKINQTEEIDTYRDDLISNDLNDIQASINFLEREDYHDKGVGHLGQDKRLTWLDALRRRKANILAQREAINKVDLAMLKQDTNATIKELGRGTTFSPDMVNQLYDRLSNYKDKPEIATLKRTLDMAVRTNKWAAKLMKQPYHIRNSILTAEAKKIQDNPLAAGMLNDLRDQSDRAELLRQSDPWTYALEYGVVDAKDIPRINYDNLDESIAARIPIGERIKNATGEGILLNVGEARQIVDMVSSNDLNTRTRVLGDIVKGAGDRYPVVLNQLIDAGLKGSIAAEAVTAAHGDVVASQTIRRGEQRMKDTKDPWITVDNKAAIDEYILDKFSGDFPISDEYRDLMVDAFRAALVGTMEFADRGEELSRDKMDSAFDMITGGMITHKGNNIMPIRGLTQREWDKYVEGKDSFDPSELIRMNNGTLPVDWKIEDIAVKVKSGEIVLLEKGLFDKNEYYMMYRGQPIIGEDANPYIFKYLPDYISIRQHDLLEQAEKIASGEIQLPDERTAPAIFDFMTGNM